MAHSSAPTTSASHTTPHHTTPHHDTSHHDTSHLHDWRVSGLLDAKKTGAGQPPSNQLLLETCTTLKTPPFAKRQLQQLQHPPPYIPERPSLAAPSFHPPPAASCTVAGSPIHTPRTSSHEQEGKDTHAYSQPTLKPHARPFQPAGDGSATQLPSPPRCCADSTRLTALLTASSSLNPSRSLRVTMPCTRLCSSTTSRWRRPMLRNMM